MGATPEIANIDELVNRRIEELLPWNISATSEVHKLAA